MRQTTICVPLEVKPESCDRLTALIDALKTREDRGGDPARPNFERVFTSIPAVHFMSMSVFPGHDYDPMFIVEANFDGPSGIFWGQVEALMGDMLRPMIRCCKRQFDGTGELYDAVTVANSHAPAVAYLEACVQSPSVFHHGNRGLTRDRILGEHQLYLALRDEIDDPARTGLNPYRVAGAAAMRTMLHAKLLPRFAWLDTPAPRRIAVVERAADYLRLIWFVVVALLVLSLPGMLLAPLVSAPLYFLITAVLAAIAAGLLWRNRHALVGTEVITRVRFKLISPQRLLLIAISVILYGVLAVTALSAIAIVIHLVSLVGEGLSIGRRVELPHVEWVTFRAVVLGLASITFTLPALILVLRYDELRDSSQNAPPVDDTRLREIERREDWITQNHMGSIVLIKPGVLRSIIIRAGHRGLGLALRVVATDGYLGSLRTVHFAHWAFLNNTGRLLFLSNFDHSWGSYLDDFIEKSHAGLTLAWGGGTGFPRTRLLVYDGASHGRQFKQWALASRTGSRFWYSAYRDLTVDQIERNYRLATGLRQASMTDKEATAWAWDL